MALYKSQFTDKIYHGCATRYLNGKGKLIDLEKCEICLIPMQNHYGKNQWALEYKQGAKQKKKDKLFLDRLNILNIYNISILKYNKKIIKFVYYIKN